MTSANWGLWHHEIHLDDELFRLPVVLEESNPATIKVITLVDKLRNYHPKKLDLHHQESSPEDEIEAQRRAWEDELDEAVFELYNLNNDQKDLIRDCCEITLPFFYKPSNGAATLPAACEDDFLPIEDYVKIFACRWNPYLNDDEKIRAAVHLVAHDNMVAVEFFPADKKFKT
jgi:hypothetical protein